MKRTVEYLVLPGYGGSGPLHWQTLWEADPAFLRVEQRDWEHPDRADWVRKLEMAVSRPGPDRVLVAHSLACLLVAHWAGSAAPASLSRVKGAFLVAPPDPAGPEFPASAAGFAPIPAERLPFPSVLVASTDDPYAAPAFAVRCAAGWGSRLVEVGPKGHINAASGLGAWEEGRLLLATLPH